MTTKDSILQNIHQMVSMGQAADALNAIQIFDQKYPKDEKMQFYKTHFFIDAGSDLRDPDIIKEGIEIGEANLSEHTNEENLAHLHYNISNGYMALFDLTERSNDAHIFTASENLQKAKSHLMEALNLAKPHQTELRKQIHVNYGNCLDTLGRCVEALMQYSEATNIDCNFTMAIGNQALTLCRFAEISGKYIGAIYKDAYDLLQKAISCAEIENYGGPNVKESFKTKAQKIRASFKNPSDLDKPSKHPTYDKKNLTSTQIEFIDFCIENKLFLNFHIHESQCEAAIHDPIFIQMYTPIEEDKFFYEMASHINQIKEDYATARYLLFQATRKNKEVDWISQRTTFTYARDYSQFNLYQGLLKSAFDEAYSILDKIAVTIVKYCNINFPVKKAAFNNIWEENGRFREGLQKTEDFSLYALYDINRDFKNSNEFKTLREIRNASTHRKLIIYNSLATNKKRGDHEIDENQMINETIRLLQLTKAAIIYLVMFINNQEKDKYDDDALVVPMYISTDQFL